MSLGIIDVFAQPSYRNINSLKLSGNIDSLKSFGRPYSRAKVVTIGTDRVTVDDATCFDEGDTVLMIQMQGVGILTPNTVTYGNYDVSFGKPGSHEFLIVLSVAPPEIVFKNNIINAFDPAGRVQLVRVPYFNSATVISESGRPNLTCDPWDSSTGKGGVLAMILGRTLTLEADINLSGRGFKGGGNGFIGDGFCQEAGTPTTDQYYNDSFRNAGIKGEGNSIHDQFKNPLFPAYARGKGPNYTAGGGGNGRFSGGGGGANRGAGGLGGSEDDACNVSYVPGTGGSGGIPATYPTIVERIFAGGGGGASTSLSGTGGEGGNGGGIVIIVSDEIISTGGKIIADGTAGKNGSGTGGAGGGGAGGSIALSLTNYGTNVLILSAKGGSGGNNVSSFGQGGGGGGGLVYVSKPTTANVSVLLSGGIATGASNGSPGEKREDFKAVLNGFLFNSIRSSVTGNDKDSICSDTKLPKITGTLPIGGTPLYTTKWEKSYDKSLWTDLGISTYDFTPPAPESNTVYYRRTITDSSTPTALVDVSKEVEIIVQPAIQGNTIGIDTTICSGQDPKPFISKAALTGGSSKNYYRYQWQDSIKGVDFKNFTGNDVKNYDPPALTNSTWYRRIVTSGRCINTSLKASVIVLPPISNNTITLPAVNEICNGMIFGNIIGSKPADLSGGDNVYRYKWEGNINSTGWTDTLGVVNLADYNPRERTGQNVYLFRRVVYSGPDDVCSITSNTVTLKDYAKITNNSISSPQTICAGMTPAMLTGLLPANGDGTYSYTWQYRSKATSGNWTNAGGAAMNFSPPVLTDTTYYRRIVGSNACADTTLQVKITVHKALNNVISTLSGNPDTTICNGQDPFALKGNVATGGTNIPGDYAYQWKSSSSLTGTYTDIPSANLTGYDPSALNATKYYKRQVVSGACTLESSPVTINVLPVISGNSFNQDQTICYNTVPVQLATAPLTGGDGNFIYKWEQSTDGTTWLPATGTSNAGSYAPPALTVPMKYRRTVTSGLSGCCSVVSNTVNINLHPALPTGAIVNTNDTTIFSTTPVSIALNLTGSGPWKVTLTENEVAGDIRDITTGNQVLSLVPEVAAGLSHFLYKISRVEDVFGCLAVSLTGEKTVIVYNESMFGFPEGFSPNGDSFNNTFEIEGLDSLTLQNLETELNIVNSAGTEVFRTCNYNGQSWKSWDGKNSKGADLPEGTYYYLLKVRFPDSSVFRKSGFVILKRY